MAHKQQEAKRDSKVSFRAPASVIGPAPAANRLAANGHQEAAGQQRRVSHMFAKQPDITVCDITGDWGLYQWSVCLFAILYSAVASVPVVLGPMLTPDIQFKCAHTNSNFDQQQGAFLAANWSEQQQKHECFKIIQLAPSQREQEQEAGAAPSTPTAQPCQSFLYDDRQLGLTLTNGFNLVCERQWLRSLVSSSALAGMLISSVTLGLFSDRFGRLRCIQLAFVISVSANACAIITTDYFLFCACIMLMSFAQIGAGNALCTLVMEITSPRFRFVPVLEYAFGWGLGVIVLPFLHQATLNYRWFMGALLAGQLLLLPWLHFGVFESVRWLLSEGHFNRAQIELRRVCRFNRVRQDGAKLAQEIASIQAQQVRKASRVIEREAAPRRLARALGTQVDETARELDMLSAAIQKSFFGLDVEEAEPGAAAAAAAAAAAPEDRAQTEVEAGRDSWAQSVAGGKEASAATNVDAPAVWPPAPLATVLSPTLSRLSFSVSELESARAPVHSSSQPRPQSRPPRAGNAHVRDQLEAVLSGCQERRNSFTTQGLIQLALKYSRVVEQQRAGSCFLTQMFHARLWRTTLILMLISVMYETSYYGLIQANKFVGKSVALNYVIGGLGDWAGAIVATIMLIVFSRKFSLVCTTLLGALVCFCLAASYHLIGEHPARAGSVEPTLADSYALRVDADGNVRLNGTLELIAEEAEALIANEANLEPVSSVELLMDQLALRNQEEAAAERAQRSLLELRDNINFYLIGLGKFVISVGIQLAATIAMEVYPNNLRQSGPGAIVFMGRVGSILAPFLFNDPSQDKRMLKLTLVVMSAIGLLVSIFVPFFIRDLKGKELMDQLNEIDDEDDLGHEHEHPEHAKPRRKSRTGV